jgi:hypothetical protein
MAIRWPVRHSVLCADTLPCRGWYVATYDFICWSCGARSGVFTPYHFDYVCWSCSAHTRAWHANRV